jgi:hypothetical protein
MIQLGTHIVWGDEAKPPVFDIGLAALLFEVNTRSAISNDCTSHRFPPRLPITSRF